MPPVVLLAAGWAGVALLSLIFFANALGVIDPARAQSELTRAGAPPRLALVAVRGGRVLQLLGASGLFFTPARPYAALALAGFLAVATLTAHAFWSAPPVSRDLQLTNFLRNTAILGGLLLAAAWRPAA